jgi:transposase
MATNVPRQVGATYKGLWRKVKKNNQDRKAGITKKRYKGLDTPPKSVSPTLTYDYQRDYSLKEDSQVSLLPLSGRVIGASTGYNKHSEWLHHGARIGAAKLWYDKPKKQFYLLISLEVEVADPTPEGKKASKKQRKANATYSKWSLAQLHSMIASKALLQKSMAVKIDAH